MFFNLKFIEKILIFILFFKKLILVLFSILVLALALTLALALIFTLIIIPALILILELVFTTLKKLLI